MSTADFQEYVFKRRQKTRFDIKKIRFLSPKNGQLVHFWNLIFSIMSSLEHSKF